MKNAVVLLLLLLLCELSPPSSFGFLDFKWWFFPYQSSLCCKLVKNAFYLLLLAALSNKYYYHFRLCFVVYKPFGLFQQRWVNSKVNKLVRFLLHRCHLIEIVEFSNSLSLRNIIPKKQITTALDFRLFHVYFFAM